MLRGALMLKLHHVMPTGNQIPARTRHFILALITASYPCKLPGYRFLGSWGLATQSAISSPLRGRVQRLRNDFRGGRMTAHRLSRLRIMPAIGLPLEISKPRWYAGVSPSDIRSRIDRIQTLAPQSTLSSA